MGEAESNALADTATGSSKQGDLPAKIEQLRCVEFDVVQNFLPLLVRRAIGCSARRQFHDRNVIGLGTIKNAGLAAMRHHENAVGNA